MTNHVDTVMKIYEAFGRGDLASILDSLSDDVRWDQGVRPTGLSYLQPGIGKAHVQRFFGDLADSIVFDVFEPIDICAGDNSVMVSVRESARNVRTGATIPEDLTVHLWRFDNEGKVSAFRHIGDFATHEKAAALVPEPASAAGSRLE